MTASAQEIVDMLPLLTDVDRAYPAGSRVCKAYDKLIPIAKEFDSSWGKDLFSVTFFSGGRLPERLSSEESGLSDEDADKAFAWFRAARGSFYPGHNDKENVCGMLLEMLFHEPKDAEDI